MGYVTILVQHAWKVQNATKQKDGNPVSYEINKTARGMVRPVSAPPRQLASKPLASHVRATVPSSIAQLVSYYNTCHNDREQHDCETAVIDMLYRLEHLVTQSTVPDTQRQQYIKISLPIRQGVPGLTSFSIPKIDRRPKKLIEQSLVSNIQGNTKYAAEARISILMLARCNSKHIRDLAMLLLCEALDTNQLETSDHEVMHLQMLWVELVHMLSNIIQVRIQRLQPLDDTDHSTKCMHLTLQRLVYAYGTGKRIQPSSLMQKSYACILQDISRLSFTDPYHNLLLSSIKEMVVSSNQGGRDNEPASMVAIGSQFPNIRRLALEKGLIPSVEYGEGIVRHIENSWVVRAAAVSALSEVYQHYREHAPGLLAREVLQSRKQKESHPIVQQLLQAPKCSIPQSLLSRRVVLLPKYISMGLADIYSELQNDYHYMRKYIDISTKSEKRKKDLKKKLKQRRLHAIQEETEHRLEAKGIFITKPEKAKEATTKSLHTPPPNMVSTRKEDVEFSNLENLILSTQPYHKKYQKVDIPPNQEDSLFKSLVQDTSRTYQPLPKIGPSFVTTKSVSKYETNLTQQNFGTANRRKMFQPPPKVPEIPQHQAIKHANTIRMPSVKAIEPQNT